MLSACSRVFGAAALTLAIAGCSGVRSESDSFASLSEARSEGAVARGWVPGGLPESTTDLRDAHLPSGTHWGRFSFPPSDGDALRRLIGAEITSAPPPCDPPGRIEWWPRLLRSPINMDTAHVTGLRLYASRDNQRVFAINWQQGQGYYWSVK